MRRIVFILPSGLRQIVGVWNDQADGVPPATGLGVELVRMTPRAIYYAQPQTPAPDQRV